MPIFYRINSSHQYTHLAATVALLSIFSRLVHENLLNFMCLRLLEVRVLGSTIAECSGRLGFAQRCSDYKMGENFRIAFERRQRIFCGDENVCVSLSQSAHVTA